MRLLTCYVQCNDHVTTTERHTPKPLLPAPPLLLLGCSVSDPRAAFLSRMYFSSSLWLHSIVTYVLADSFPTDSAKQWVAVMIRFAIYTTQLHAGRDQTSDAGILQTEGQPVHGSHTRHAVTVEDILGQQRPTRTLGGTAAQFCRRCAA